MDYKWEAPDIVRVRTVPKKPNDFIFGAALYTIPLGKGRSRLLFKVCVRGFVFFQPLGSPRNRKRLCFRLLCRRVHFFDAHRRYSDLLSFPLCFYGYVLPDLRIEIPEDQSHDV